VGGPALAVAGAWSGTTSQGKPVSFTVEGNRITSIVVGYHVGSCGIQEDQSRVTYGTAGDAPTIGDNGSFFAMVPGPGGSGFVSVNGRFADPRTASGTVQVTAFTFGEANTFPCFASAEATWNANR
jgi:hypothetical protein